MKELIFLFKIIRFRRFRMPASRFRIRFHVVSQVSHACQPVGHLGSHLVSCGLTVSHACQPGLQQLHTGHVIGRTLGTKECPKSRLIFLGLSIPSVANYVTEMRPNMLPNNTSLTPPAPQPWPSKGNQAPWSGAVPPAQPSVSSARPPRGPKSGPKPRPKPSVQNTPSDNPATQIVTHFLIFIVFIQNNFFAKEPQQDLTSFRRPHKNTKNTFGQLFGPTFGPLFGPTLVPTFVPMWFQFWPNLWVPREGTPPSSHTKPTHRATN